MASRQKDTGTVHARTARTNAAFSPSADGAPHERRRPCLQPVRTGRGTAMLRDADETCRGRPRGRAGMVLASRPVASSSAPALVFSVTGQGRDTKHATCHFSRPHPAGGGEPGAVIAACVHVRYRRRRSEGKGPQWENV